MDFFAGSGTLGEAAAQLGREFILIDNNPEAIDVMVKRLQKFKPQLINCDGIVEPTQLKQDDIHGQLTLF